MCIIWDQGLVCTIGCVYGTSPHALYCVDTTCIFGSGHKTTVHVLLLIVAGISHLKEHALQQTERIWIWRNQLIVIYIMCVCMCVCVCVCVCVCME